MRSLRLLALVVLFLGLTPSPAAASDIRNGDVTVASGETINDDLYVFGGNIAINGTINGDLIAAGNSISVDGTVTGDVIAAGETVAIRGQVGRDLQAGSTNVKIDGGIGGNVLASVDRLQLTDRATVGGNLKYTSKTEAQIANTSSVKGSIERQTPANDRAPLVTGPAALVLEWLKGLIGLLILGILVVFFFPGFARRAGEALVRSPWLPLAFGALVLIGLPILAVLFFVVGTQ